MQPTIKNTVLSLVSFTILLFLPLASIAQDATRSVTPGPPPISQNLVREGDFAVKLQISLGIGSSEDEVEAETALGDLGISPKNGWIADYPVTPDILGEIRSSLLTAASQGKVDLNSEEAIKRLDEVSAELQMGVKPHSANNNHQASPEEAVKYPNPTVINNYYTNEGPPVVTYYAPPPDYYYLYGWVPYPFWWAGFWFPGYFILNDFHRPYFYGSRTVFISNHFNHFRAHRVFRIDPVQRYSGRTYAGIGAPARKGYISTGVPRSDQRIFNAPRARNRTDSGSSAPSTVRRSYEAPGAVNIDKPRSGAREDFRGGSRMDFRGGERSGGGGSRGGGGGRGGGEGIRR